MAVCTIVDVCNVGCTNVGPYSIQILGLCYLLLFCYFLLFSDASIWVSLQNITNFNAFCCILNSICEPSCSKVGYISH